MGGIDSIIEMIEQKTKSRVDTILQRAEDYRTRKVKTAMEEAKRIHLMKEANARREAQAVLKRHEANAKLRAKQKVLRAKNDLIDEVMKKTLEQAIALANKKKFEPIVRRMIIDAGTALAVAELEVVIPKGQKLTLDLTEIAREIEKQTGKKTKLMIAKDKVEASGGVIVRTKDGTKWVDNTIEARYERLQGDIRDKIYSILFAQSK